MNSGVNPIPMGTPHGPRIPADADLTDFKRLLSKGKLEQAIHLIESGLVDKESASREIHLYLLRKDIDNDILWYGCIAGFAVAFLLFLLRISL